MFFIFQSPPFFCIYIIPQSWCYCQAFEESFFDIWEKIFSKKWLILLDKMFELWYNIKIGSQRPLTSRKIKFPLVYIKGVVD